MKRTASRPYNVLSWSQADIDLRLNMPFCYSNQLRFRTPLPSACLCNWRPRKPSFSDGICALQGLTPLLFIVSLSSSPSNFFSLGVLSSLTSVVFYIGWFLWRIGFGIAQHSGADMLFSAVIFAAGVLIGLCSACNEPAVGAHPSGNTFAQPTVNQVITVGIPFNITWKVCLALQLCVCLGHTDSTY